MDKLTETQWKQKLSPEQYKILRQADTEAPFTGKYTYSHDDGTYACGACGNVLFSSDQKFDSGSGWPSFTDVVKTGSVTLKKDKTLGMVRTEVLCARCGSHLGHVFDDGPGPTGLRYCINSLALDFHKE